MKNTSALGLKYNVGSPSIREQIIIWHYRLEHPSFAYLKHLLPLFYAFIYFGDVSLNYCMHELHKDLSRPKLNPNIILA